MQSANEPVTPVSQTTSSVSNNVPATNTNISTSQDYVGFWKRFLAYWIDGLILGIITLPVSAAFGAFNFSAAATTHTTNPVGSLFGFVIGAAYFIFFWVNQNGQTLGQRLLAIKVQKEDGQPIDIGTAVIRYIGYLISSVVFALGFIWIAFDSKKQGWHDKMARTVVVKTDGKSHTTIALVITVISFLLFIALIAAIVVGGLFLVNYLKAHPNSLNTNTYNQQLNSSPTVNSQASPSNQQFDSLYMTSCNPTGKQTAFCNCTLQYLHSHFSNQEIAQMGIQYTQTHQQPSGLQSAITACYSQIQR